MKYEQQWKNPQESWTWQSQKKKRSIGGSPPPMWLEEAMVWVGSKPELLEGRQD